MLKLEDIITKMKSQIDTNKEKIGKTDISEVSTDDTLTTGLVEANEKIHNIDDSLGTQVTYRTVKQSNGDYWLYITTKENAGNA